jgi:hypothetical protein
LRVAVVPGFPYAVEQDADGAIRFETDLDASKDDLVRLPDDIPVFRERKPVVYGRLGLSGRDFQFSLAEDAENGKTDEDKTEDDYRRCPFSRWGWGVHALFTFVVGCQKEPGMVRLTM